MLEHGQKVPRRSFVAVALLVICALLTHSLDNCAAHLGGFERLATGIQQGQSPCRNAAGPCELCAPVQPHSDGCKLLSEVAALNSSTQHQFEHQAVTLVATVAVLPAMPQLIALSGCLHGLAAPPPTPFLSSSLRSDRPNRAPPISA